MSPGRAALTAGGLLFVVYVATLAPSVTLWDSGEFLAAIRTLGVPHPPATPLFVFVANVWSRLLGWLPFALSVNVGSAAATAAAAASFAWLLTRWTGRADAGLAGTLVGGTMASVWLSATETEVYAYALLAIALGLVAAELAGSRWSRRHRLLLPVIFGLAVPLHISVLVAGPAMVLLAATDGEGSVALRAALAPAGAWCLAVGIGTVSALPALVGVSLLLGAAAFPLGGAQETSDGEALKAGLVTVLCASFLLVLLLRARFDPAVNQGNPSTWQAMWDVVGRRQYDVPPLWPRRSPLWLQLGNVIQYADWQVASAMSDAPGPSPWRTPFTLLFVALGAMGAHWHRQRDRRSWWILAVLFASASAGVVVVLNLRAGPSFGWGVLPDDALREARERDYFFALAFMVGGLWCGCGIAALRDRLRSYLRTLVPLLVVLPLVLNWRAVDRRRGPDAMLAERIGAALLLDLPENAVLVMAGDNDSYPVWFAQQVLRQRPDVIPVTVPLLGAGWYRAEMARRFHLLDSAKVATWRGLPETLAAIGASAGLAHRALFAAVSIGPTERRALGVAGRWRMRGMTYQHFAGDSSSPLDIDSGAVERSTRAIEDMGDEGWLQMPSRDPAGRYVQRLMRCPSAARDRVIGRPDASGRLLESICNYR